MQNGDPTAPQHNIQSLGILLRCLSGQPLKDESAVTMCFLGSGPQWQRSAPTWPKKLISIWVATILQATVSGTAGQGSLEPYFLVSKTKGCKTQFISDEARSTKAFKDPQNVEMTLNIPASLELQTSVVTPRLPCASTLILEGTVENAKCWLFQDFPFWALPKVNASPSNRQTRILNDGCPGLILLRPISQSLQLQQDQANLQCSLLQSM